MLNPESQPLQFGVVSPQLIGTYCRPVCGGLTCGAEGLLCAAPCGLSLQPRRDGVVLRCYLLEPLPPLGQLAVGWCSQGLGDGGVVAAEGEALDIAGDVLVVPRQSQRQHAGLVGEATQHFVEGDVGGRGKQYPFAAGDESAGDLRNDLRLAGPGWALDEVGMRRGERAGHGLPLQRIEGSRRRLGIRRRYRVCQLLGFAQQRGESGPVPRGLLVEKAVHRIEVALKAELAGLGYRHPAAGWQPASQSVGVTSVVRVTEHDDLVGDVRGIQLGARMGVC